MPLIILRLTLAGMFLFASATKLFSVSGDVASQSIYGRLLANKAERISLAACEAALASWLLSGFRRRYSALTTIMLLSAFSGLIIVELGRDRPQPCGCMGAEYVAAHDPAAVRRSLEWSLARNALMIGAATWLFMIEAPGEARFRSGRSPNPLGTAFQATDSPGSS